MCVCQCIPVDFHHTYPRLKYRLHEVQSQNWWWWCQVKGKLNLSTFRTKKEMSSCSSLLHLNMFIFFIQIKWTDTMANVWNTSYTNRHPNHCTSMHDWLSNCKFCTLCDRDFKNQKRFFMFMNLNLEIEN